MSVELRPFAEEHLAATFAWMSDPAIYGPFLRRSPPTRDGHAAWFASLAPDPSQRVFAIEEHGRHVGNCGLKNLDPTNQRAELWIYLGERGRGLGTAATQRLVAHSRELGVEKVYVHVDETNPAARRVYEKSGFVLEGTLRDELLIEGRRVTLLRMALPRP